MPVSSRASWFGTLQVGVPKVPVKAYGIVVRKPKVACTRSIPVADNVFNINESCPKHGRVVPELITTAYDHKLPQTAKQSIC